MTKEEMTVLIVMASPCKSSTDESNTDETYGLGTGTGDGLCEPDYDSSTYDPFPADHSTYPLFDAATANSWSGDDFESYSHNSTIASASGGASHIDVTSGILKSKHLNGSQVSKRAWTNTHNFRMLADAEYDQKKLRYTDGTQQIRVYFDAVHTQPAHYAGAHLFTRYQTENDLYVASLRLDGQVMIKKKHCDSYSTLATAPFSQGAVSLDTWYEISFAAYGNNLTLYVDGEEELSVNDDTFSWGSMGVRIDYTDTYMDDWYILP